MNAHGQPPTSPRSHEVPTQTSFLCCRASYSKAFTVINPPLLSLHRHVIPADERFSAKNEQEALWLKRLWAEVAFPRTFAFLQGGCMDTCGNITMEFCAERQGRNELGSVQWVRFGVRSICRGLKAYTHVAASSAVKRRLFWWARCEELGRTEVWETFSYLAVLDLQD